MESFINYKVTNAELFNSVDDVEFNLTSHGGTYKFKYRDAYFRGDVSIEINGEKKPLVVSMMQTIMQMNMAFKLSRNM